MNKIHITCPSCGHSFTADQYDEDEVITDKEPKVSVCSHCAEILCALPGQEFKVMSALQMARTPEDQIEMLIKVSRLVFGMKRRREEQEQEGESLSA